MVDIHHEGIAAAPLPVAFAYIDDYRTTTDWMFGLSSFQPAPGAPAHGLGAIFDVVFSVKPVKLKSTIQITEWEQDALLAFESTDGFRNWSTWRFVEEDAARTRVVVDFSYELPGGLAGKALGRALEPVVALSVRHSDATLRKHIEARAASA